MQLIPHHFGGVYSPHREEDGGHKVLQNVYINAGTSSESLLSARNNDDLLVPAGGTDRKVTEAYGYLRNLDRSVIAAHTAALVMDAST